MAAKAKQTAVPGRVPGMALSILLALLACSCEKSLSIGEPSSDDIVFRSAVPAATLASAKSTKASVVTANDLIDNGFRVSATCGPEEAEVWTDVPFVREGDVFKGGKWWPAVSASYHFYAANVPLRYQEGRTTVAASAEEDVVCAYLPSPVYKSTNTLSFQHIFASIGTVTVVALDDYAISDVSVRLTPRLSGIYDLAEGAGRVDGTGWSSTVSGDPVTVATSIGAHENDLWLVPGAYSLDLEWTATKGDYAERFIGRSVEVAIAAGEVSQLRIGLRGSGATDIAFDISVASRGLRTIDIDDVLAHTGVDLGIRTEEGRRLLFANENVGGEREVDPGDFFAFGETSRQYDAVDGAMVGGANDLTFSWSSAPYWVSGSGTSSRWSRYTADKDGYAATGLSDGLSVLLPEDDVARRQWGCNWRLPTREEWRKLIDSCSWEWLDNYCGSGVPGYVVRGAGAAIFLPAAGYCEKSYASPSTPTRYYENLQGCYWSSSVYERIPAMAQSLHFAEDAYLVGYDDRCLGATVRAVCEVD